jgi:hypothetical protein
VASTNGAGVAHRFDADARKIDRLGGKVDFLATQEHKPFQPICAELSGPDACSAAGITVRAAAPVLELCRALIDAGHDPATRLEAYRGETLCLGVRSIGEAARGDGQRHSRLRRRRRGRARDSHAHASNRWRRAMTADRSRLPNRRASESFTLEVAGLRYSATVSRFTDGRIGELFLSNHKTNSAADVNARDAAIVFSFAVQHGANPEKIRRALCRDNQGRASGPLGAAVDVPMGRKP